MTYHLLARESVQLLHLHTYTYIYDGAKHTQKKSTIYGNISIISYRNSSFCYTLHLRSAFVKKDLYKVDQFIKDLYIHMRVYIYIQVKST